MSGLESVSTTFVGRTFELDLLRRAIERSISGSSRVITLSGEPGIGKTSLSKQATEAATDRGMTVLEARCYEREGIPTYWPWITIIRRFAATCKADHLLELLGSGARDIAKIVDDVAAIPGIEIGEAAGDDDQLDPHRTRFKLFDSVTRFIVAVCLESPLLIFIDNLHCADLGSLQLLEFVAQECDAIPLLILATYRDNELTPSHPLNFTLGELSRHIGHEHLGLKGLTRNEIAQLFARSAEGSETDKGLIDVVGEKTDGNPLYLKEVLAAQQTGRGIGQTAAEMAKRLIIPDTLRATIRGRIHAMGDVSRRVLVAASLLGREFEVPMLRRFVERFDDSTVDVASVDEKLLMAMLQEAQGAAIIEPVEDRPGALRFCHALIQEVVLDDAGSIALDPHWQVASFLEDEYGSEADDHASEIFPHYALARENEATERARHFAYEAAFRAWKNSSYEAAIEHLEPYAAGIKTIPTNSEDAALVALIGRSLRDAGEIAPAAEYLGKAFAFYEQSGDISRAADIATERLFFFQEDSAVIDWIERAKELVDPSSESGILVAAFAAFQNYDWLYATQETKKELIHYLDASVKAGFRRAELVVVSFLSFVENQFLQLDEASRYARRGVELARELDDPRSEIASRCAFHLAYTTTAGVGERQKNIDAALETADHIRDRRLISFCLSLRSRSFLVAGRFDDSLKDLARLEHIQADLSRYRGFRRNRAWIAAETGDFHILEHEIEDAVEALLSGSSRLRTGWFPYIPKFMRITRDYRNIPKMRELYEAALAEVSAAAGLRWRALLGLGCIAFLEQDSEAAERWYSELVEIYGGESFARSYEERTLGLAAEAAGKFDDAREWYESALTSHEKSGARIEFPWDCYDLARMLITHGQPEDMDRARDLLARGAVVAKELGMPPVLERIQEELRRFDTEHVTDAGASESGTSSQGGADPFGELTKRELDVLEHVARGMTNQEIARELFISEHTAANHVRHILEKLRVGNRIEAATMAARHGLGDMHAQ